MFQAGAERIECVVALCAEALVRACELGLLERSVVICEYFDSFCPGARIFPAKDEARWQALRLHALADGLSDAAITVRRESRRPDGLQWTDWAEAHARKLEQTYDLMAKDADVLSGSVTIGHVALATALEWIAFRNVEPASDRDGAGWRIGTTHLHGVPP